MKKLQLNKKTVTALNKAEMRMINGGQQEAISIASCKRGSDRGKDCCNSGRVDISASTVSTSC
ncbi:hypothetical protein HYN56_19790 [Flavobacterium crocinum]|uniref:Uncharacterized protein n=1 Tax=Flavobacterium crocinum TaxID=2183896 RepID=A0A2S1YQK7_9FLAO|nr:class I lanthipeptide [Flavobacterium crocinum]AWK06346.1 hypothetical protein HYN56_19790 [Flavobacterium crocinum]